MARQNKSAKRIISILKWVFLTGLFLLCLFGIYHRYIFQGITWVLERSFDAEVYWDRAPFLYYLFRVGFGIVFSWVITKGVYNILGKHSFFKTVYWGRLFIVVFCVVFFGAISQEIDNFVPKHRTEVTEDESPTPVWPLRIGAMICIGLIGWALWRQLERWQMERYGKFWDCGHCGTINSVWLEKCGNPKCKQPRGTPRLE